MNVLIDAAGVVQACGDSDSFAPSPGGSVLAAATNPLIGLAPGEEAYWDGTQFGKRLHVPTADEADYNDIRDKLQNALANWATLTAAQKDALLRACVRGLLRSLR